MKSEKKNVYYNSTTESEVSHPYQQNVQMVGSVVTLFHGSTGGWILPKYKSMHT